MAEQVNLKVELQSNLEQLVGATKGVKLDKGQEQRVEKYTKGAQLALESGDLKTFQRNFNGLLKTFKDAAAATGKVSEEIQKLTARQSALSKEINELRDKKTKLETHSSGGKLTNEGANAYYKDSKDATKVVKADGIQATRDEIIKFQEELVKVLKEAKRNFQTMTTEDVTTAASKTGVNITTRSAAQAANRYVKGENAYAASLPGQINATNTELNTKEQEYATLTTELTRMTQAATDGAESIEKLYAEISRLGDVTNKLITEENNKNTKKKADTNIATQGADIKTNQAVASGSGLGKAFKQFTLYNVALRAVKKAVREAVQTVKELDKYLTEQAMVTGMTRQETYNLVGSYQKLAMQCGATTKEIAQVSTEYMKQGKTVQESLVLTEAAVKAAKVARVSVGDSVNYLTTALNGFRLEAEDAMKVSDKFAALAASSATDYDELAIALSKVASQANLAGMSLDYTAALLTKGLETTREAPETMGTALKTIIARMRELGDYGETLDDGMDINNVESQLQYVGIALRDSNGELRSTEDVLDELGKKWDTLNKNQQAAIAKALAGTRQQSRLIAMMEDYERVTELQEISQRSAGATAAQAGVYLEGMEAALNKIQVAWEKIVMTVTDSEFIIDTISFIGDTLDFIGEFLSTDFGMVATLGTVLTLITQGLTAKIQEIAYAKQQQKIERAALKIKLKLRKSQIEELKLEKKKTLEDKKQNIQEEYAGKIKAANGDATKIALLKAEEKTALAAAEATYNAEILDLEAEEYSIESQLTQLETSRLQGAMGVASATATTAGLFGGLLGDSMTFMTIMSVISGILQLIPTFINIATIAQKKQNKEALKGALLSEAGGLAKFWPWGVFAAAALLAIIGIAVAIGNINSQSSDGVDQINELSDEIYKLNEKAVAINKITDSFDKLDNKLIKTKADVEEMNSLLDQAAEQMDNEDVDDKDNEGFGKGKNEREYYESLDDEGKRIYLEKKSKQLDADLRSKREEQKDVIRNMSQSELNELFNEESTNADTIKAQGAIYALNNQAIYDKVDALKKEKGLTDEVASSIESLTQSMMENLSVKDAWSFADDPAKVNKLTETIANLRTEAKNLEGELEDISLAEVLDSDDYSTKDKVEAYKELIAELEKLGPAYRSALQGFKDEYKGLEEFAKMSSNVLDFIDDVGLSNDEINELWASWEKLQKAGVKNKKGELISEEVFEGRFALYMEELAKTQGDVLAATQKVFGDYLDGSEKTLNAFISAYGDLVQVGILNMGQNMDKTKNTINSFYDKALEWNEMSESDKAEFIQDNAELFADNPETEKNEGQELLKAFNSGNYAEIQEALKNSDALKKQIDKRKAEIEQELLIEEARVGKDRNEAYIAQLKEYKEYLEQGDDLFLASLELRLEQEEKQLDEYKSLVEKEQEVLIDSLEKRKEAYEKYFEEIDKQQEDEDYEEESSRLITNISKLASSGDADARAKTMELEQELKELEAERLQTLKERAREAILENMDNEIEEINDKFDKLLDSNQALLAAMQGDLENPTEFLAEMIGNKFADGATKLELEDYIGNLESIYGNTLDGVNWDAIKEEVIEQLFLNVNGQDITLNEIDERAVYEAIKKALQSIGKR